MDELIRQTTLGMVRGVAQAEYDYWHGIPFAQPPVGALRFKRSVPHAKWEEVRVCDTMGPKPIQMAGGKFAELTASDTPESEDCLTLNVWAPKHADNRPVMVWIYGGGAHAGEASAPEYDLKQFAKQDIVAVSFNYRLGVLGFYDFSDLDTSYESNCGMSDIILALKWVHENIASFGGNPNRVTIVGESAGATAVLALMATPTARPYFQQIISMSGVASNITGAWTQQVNRKRFLSKIGLKSEEIGKLRTLPIEQLKKGCALFFEGEKHDNPGMLVDGPVLDDLVTEYPIDAIRNGKTQNLACLFGTCKDEGGLFHFMKLCPETWEEIEQMLTLNGYADRIPLFHDVYGKMEASKAIKAINRDRMFWADTMKCALAQSKYDKTYVYRFDYTTPISYFLKMGATHTMDICPALDTYTGGMATLYKGVPKREQKKLHETVHEAFVAFVKMGTPQWAPFDMHNSTIMVFDRKSRIEQYQLDQTRYDLWKDLSFYLDRNADCEKNS